MRDATPQGTYRVQALDRAFAVLDLLGESETPLGLAQVATSLQLHKSTAHRFLMVLERHHMVERTTNGKFRLGLRLFDFGNRAIEQYDLRERAQPHLRRLVAETEETAHLCVLEQARVIYIDKIEPARSVRMITRIGSSNPVHCTSVGKAILAFAVALLETLALLALGVGLLGLHLPTSAGRWLTLAWVLVLGAATCSLLGVAVSSLIKVTTRSAVAVLNLPYLVLSFISGVYFVFSQLPASLQRVAAIFPLKWICQGLRSAFLPDKLLAAEPAHSWEHGRIALVLGAWLVASLVICIRTFRWQETGRR